jgi:sec-independent protein translocase protein TatB
MFDVGFSELMVIAVVALIVIGPERLPKVARTMGHLFGRLQRYVNDVKADINREIELEELRKFKTNFEDAARSVQESIQSEATKTEAELNALTGAHDPSVPSADAAAAPAQAEGGGTISEELKQLKEGVEDAARSMQESAAARGNSSLEAASPDADPARQKTPA